jgi:hypothetical protein
MDQSREASTRVQPQPGQLDIITSAAIYDLIVTGDPEDLSPQRK